MVGLPEEGGLKEVSGGGNDIIISDSFLKTIVPPQLKNMSACKIFMCGCECCIHAKSIHFFNNTKI